MLLFTAWDKAHELSSEKLHVASNHTRLWVLDLKVPEDREHGVELLSSYKHL